MAKRRRRSATTRTEAEWRKTIDDYVRLRDLERTDFKRELRRFVEALKCDAEILHRASLRRHIGASYPDGFKVSDYSARAIRRRLAASEYGERHLRFTDNFLERLQDEVLLETRTLRLQGWLIAGAAEVVLVWTERFKERRDELAAMEREKREGSRRSRKVRGPSVGLDFLIGDTRGLSTADIAEKLVQFGVMPERENETNDPVAQWQEAIRRARQRHKKRYAR